VTDYKNLLVESTRPGVLQVTLNRPARRNAIDRATHRELSDLLVRLRHMPDLGAVVLTGAGDAFCAGGDFGLMEEFQRDDWRRTVRMLDEGTTLVRDLLQVPLPVVAAVNGGAYGLGATLALLCDFVVICESANLADTHVRAGIVAGDGGTLVWPHILGHVRAKEFLLTGDPVDAKTALSMGMVNRVVPTDEVLPAALEVAGRLAAGPREAIAWTKQAINTTLLREASQQMPLAIALEARSMLLPDHREGIAAFRERRPAAWPSNETEPLPDF
jgi:enoyl-CoA hydratase